MPKIPVVLASAPVSELDEAIRVSKMYGITRSAGDATDRLNAKVLDVDDAWKVAWLGKTAMAIDITADQFPVGTVITLVAIAGGPACDWERGQLRNKFCIEYPNTKLKQIGDVEDYVGWLEKNFGEPTAPEV